MIVRVENRKLFTGLLAALVVLAWLGLWLWGESPYGRFLDHHQLSEITNQDASLLVFFVAGWTLMVFAMMLPTSLPLIALFHTMTRSRPDHKWLLALLITGYIGTWAWFGLAIHLADLVFHEFAELSPWLSDNAWAFGADEQAPGHTPADVGHYAGSERPIFCILTEQWQHLLFTISP
jgi:predicted metal-binding membrane protein